MARMMPSGRGKSRTEHPEIDPPVNDMAGGRAFTIDEALLAMRWAELVRERGYRLSISHRSRKADEILEVHILASSKAISRLHKGSRVIWSTDCLGHTRPFDTLADALLAIVPLSIRDRRTLLKAKRPAWLDFPPWSGNRAKESRSLTQLHWLDQLVRKLRITS